MNKQPIGIFDSGVGGLTVLREIQKLMPDESFIYLGDGQNAPYGTKTKREIQNLSTRNVDFLLEKECKLIVVACNTATTQVIEFLRSKYSVLFVGIEPAIKPAALQSKTKSVGVLATHGTIHSALFNETKERFGSHVNVTMQVGTGLVPMIENNQVDSREMTELLQKLLQPMIESNADFIVLGCTHYPLIKTQISKLYPFPVSIIDSSYAVAKRVEHLVSLKKMQSSSKNARQIHYFTTGNPKKMDAFIELLELPKHRKSKKITF